MAMKLLKKQEVLAKKSVEKRAEVEEGLKLARKVDSLREIHLQEERSLQEFRDKTVAIINNDIVDATVKRDALLTEVKQLNKDRALGMTEVNRLMAEAYEKIAEANNEKHVYGLMLEDIKTTDADAKEALAQAKRTLAQAQTKLIDVQNALAEAAHFRTEAKLHKEQAVEILLEAQDTQQRVSKDLKERDAVLASKERDFKIKEDRLKKLENELRLQKKKLDDRNEMIERTLKRNKK